MMFANRIGSSTGCSIWLPETSPPSPFRGGLRHRFKVATLPLGGSPLTASRHGSADCLRRKNVVPVHYGIRDLAPLVPHESNRALQLVPAKVARVV